MPIILVTWEAEIGYIARDLVSKKKSWAQWVTPVRNPSFLEIGYGGIWFEASPGKKLATNS
jgi:hypothetical protein